MAETKLTEKEVRTRVKKNWRVKDTESIHILADWNNDGSIKQNKQFEVVSHAGSKTLGFFIVKKGRIYDVTK